VNWIPVRRRRFRGKRLELRYSNVGHVDEALQLIGETPAGCPKWNVDQRFRRAVVQRFPYLVFYRDLADRIEVVAVAHGAREPGYWLKRK
jgi:plasmid stabilization system protein ParE